MTDAMTDLIVAGRDSEYSVRADALATDRAGALYVASLAGPAGAVKGAMAALTASGRLSVYPVADLHTPDGGYRGFGRYSSLARCGAGYRRRLHRLDYGWAHAVYLARDPRLLPCTDDETLWRALAGPGFTTPLLRDWMPYVRKGLVARRGLVPLFALGCAPALLVATDAMLDDVARAGCADGAFSYSFFGLRVAPQSREAAG